MKRIKLAIVHDDFIQKGGAEYLVWEIIKYYHSNEKYEVEVFTSIVGDEWKRIFENSKIRFHSSFLQKFPLVQKYQKVLAITCLYFLAFESFNFDGFDLVISSSTRYAHSIITKPDTFHVSYVNSPPKMLWEIEKYYFGRKNLYNLIKFFLPKLRIYDSFSRERADLICSNSQNIAGKVSKNYHLASSILYPFLINEITETKQPVFNVPQNFYLLISRLSNWKRIDYVIECFNQNNQNLIIVGDGEMLKNYQQRANSNIQLVGYLNSPHKNYLLSKCTALIFPQDEDFGLVLLEALNFSKPIIYFNKGGAKEILSPSLGVPFDEQSYNSLSRAIKDHSEKTYNSEEFTHSLHKFQKEEFLSRLNEITSEIFTQDSKADKYEI